MLIRMKIRNYRSFNAEAELSMVSSSKIRKMATHVVQFSKVKVLKHAAIYGANASGKSNLIDGFRFIQRTLRSGLELKSTKLYCRNSDENKDKTSLFEITFSIGESFYAYGFEAVLSQRRITEEWLYDLTGRSPKPLLERVVAERSITTELDFDERENVRFQLYANDFAENESKLFLAELNRSKRFDSDSPFIIFEDVYDWIMGSLRLLSPSEPVSGPLTTEFLLNQSVKQSLVQILSSFDTGVSGIELEHLSQEELTELVPRPILRSLLEEAQRGFEEENERKIELVFHDRKNLVFVMFLSDGSVDATTLKLEHANTHSLFDFDEESDGTRRLFDLINLLLVTDEDVVFVVDELERSLHPMLVRQLLLVFAEMHAERKVQLVFSTHESSIMDQDLFRRDEIWFVDRGITGCSSLYSLDRFKERFDKDISKAYLEGRYGAIPVFSDLGLSDRGGDHASNSGV